MSSCFKTIQSDQGNHDNIILILFDFSYITINSPYKFYSLILLVYFCVRVWVSFSPNNSVWHGGVQKIFKCLVFKACIITLMARESSHLLWNTVEDYIATNSMTTSNQTRDGKLFCLTLLAVV